MNKNSDSDNLFVKYTTKKGEYLYNPNNKVKTNLYDHIYRYLNGYLIEKDGLFGLMDISGNEIVSPRYKKSIKTDKYPRPIVPDKAYPYLVCDYEGKEIEIYSNGKYYGIISLDFDGCSRIRYTNYYIVKKDNKYGVVSKWERMILPTQFVSIKTYEEYYGPTTCILAVVQDVIGFFLFNLQKAEILTEHYDSIEFLQEKNLYRSYRNSCSFYIGEKYGKKRILSCPSKFLTDLCFDEIVLFRSRFLKVRNGSKWGLVNRRGELIVPINYDSIESICNNIVNVINAGKITQIEVDHSKFLYNETLPINTWETSSYGKYTGSYAQDEMGYSDDDIDTIFDGDPSAYWNID